MNFYSSHSQTRRIKVHREFAQSDALGASNTNEVNNFNKMKRAGKNIDTQNYDYPTRVPCVAKKTSNYKHMKQTIVLIVILLFTGNTFAQSISQSQIPAVVLNSFQLKFPNAKDIKWKKEKENYRVDFKVNSKLNEIKMDYRGRMLKHSQDLYVSEVPEVVQETILTKLAYFDMHDADRYEEGGKITYEIRFKQDGKNHFFWTNEKGKLLKYRQELNDDEIPSSIINLINSTYGTLDIDQSKYVEENGKNIYIIRGHINNDYHLFTVDDKTTVINHYKDLQNDEIPAPVLKTLSQSYKGYDIRDADLVERDERTIYILKIRNSKEQIYVSFNSNGKVLDVK